MKQLTAIIPMKGHSRRIPGKNMRSFNGKPLYHWILDTLSYVESVKKIIIDTDSQSIAQKVKNYPGVEISMRPETLRGDFVSVNRLIEYILSLYPNEKYFIQTHVTNPLLKVGTLNGAIDLFMDSLEYDSLFSVTAHYARFYISGNAPVNHNPRELLRTQDLEPLLEENSCFYLFSRDSFQKVGARIGKQPYLYKMDKLEAVDIDEEEDFILAEVLMKYIRG